MVTLDYSTTLSQKSSGAIAMTLNSLDSVLKKLMSQQAWQHQRRFKIISDLWQTQLPKRTRQYSRPQTIRDNTLFVATANNTWSQHLTLQRLTILKKLNRLLPPQDRLTDLRFSTAHWQQKPAYSPLADPDSPHPSRITNRSPQPPRERPQSPAEAVHAWYQQQQQPLKNQPLCPQCHTPTPAGELERWQVCRCCITQRWSQENSVTNDLS